MADPPPRIPSPPPTAPELPQVRCPKCRGGRLQTIAQCTLCVGTGRVTRAAFSQYTKTPPR